MQTEHATSPFFGGTKDNNGVQNFPIYPNNDSKCAFSGDNIYIYYAVKLKFICIKLQLVLIVRHKKVRTINLFLLACTSCAGILFLIYLSQENFFNQVNKATESSAIFKINF